MNSDFLTRTQEAIEAIKNGEMVIIMDEADRENEGDLVYAGIFSSPEKVNFMAKFARGLICVSLTQKRAIELDLPPMVAHNDSNHETAFTISIDAKAAKTGISAYERDLTIRLMCDKSTKPSDFVRPGHIFPLIAKDGGVLVRTGHTEASVDLCKLAGVAPVSVICEIMKEDGSMAGNGDKFILDFAKEHNLKILYVSDLIAYRLQNENLVIKIDSQTSEFLNETCEKIAFRDSFNNLHYVVKFKGESSIPLIKFHHIKNDYEFLSESENYAFFMRSVEALKKQGGYLIFMNKSNSEVHKSFGIGAQILKDLGIKQFKLLTQNNRDFFALSGFGLEILESVVV